MSSTYAACFQNRRWTDMMRHRYASLSLWNLETGAAASTLCRKPTQPCKSVGSIRRRILRWLVPSTLQSRIANYIRSGVHFIHDQLVKSDNYSMSGCNLRVLMYVPGHEAERSHRRAARGEKSQPGLFRYHAFRMWP